MFTGIIETTGIIREIETTGTNKSFWIESAISKQLKIDQSVSHSGVCLTIEEVRDTTYKITAILETLNKTNLGEWKTGDSINLERCLQLSARLDGHFVQGHVDTKAEVLDLKDMNGSWQFTFRFPKEFAALVIEKGSVAVNGVSLTAFNVTDDTFTVAIIPYTWHHTSFKNIQKGQFINLEFDLLGKYIVRNLHLQK